MLTEEMINEAKSVSQIGGLKFKYSPAYDIQSVDPEPKSHRIMCKGEATKNKWIWLGRTDAPIDFSSAEQAKLFLREITTHQKQLEKS